MKASIIIPTYNRADQLFRTLKSLSELEFDPKEFEIIVVDNGSTDNSKKIVDDFISQHPKNNIRYFYDDIPGLLTGRHRGAKESRAEILIFIDDDIHADKGWLTAILNTFNDHPDVHLVGGKCLPVYESNPPQWLKYFWKDVTGGGKMMIDLSLCDFGEAEKEVHPTWVWGLNFSIRKKTFYEAGGFHPDSITPEYQRYQGDGETGLSFKILSLGYKAFYNPKALVHHEVPASRMTFTYFEKRSFYQGVCNSYTEIRQNGGFNQSKIKTIFTKRLRPFAGRILRKLKLRSAGNEMNNLSSTERSEMEELTKRFSKMEKAGYDFHQENAKKSPAVLKWILKENYFDYKLPE